MGHLSLLSPPKALDEAWLFSLLTSCNPGLINESELINLIQLIELINLITGVILGTKGLLQQPVLILLRNQRAWPVFHPSQGFITALGTATASQWIFPDLSQLSLIMNNKYLQTLMAPKTASSRMQ